MIHDSASRGRSSEADGSPAAQDALDTAGKRLADPRLRHSEQIRIPRFTIPLPTEVNPFEDRISSPAE